MEKYVCVVGGANIDICSYAYKKLILKDSNPSKTTLSLGGVGRNVAENLARLNVKVEFVSVLGNDVYAEQIKQSCQSLNIGLGHSIFANVNTSTYLCVNDEKGDMFIGASDMEIFERIDTQFLAKQLDFLNNAVAVVIDANLTRQSLEYLIQNVTAPTFIETVSANKTQKLVGINGAFCIKPNVIEAEMLSNQKINSIEDLYSVGRFLQKNSAKWIVITLGEKGAYYNDGEKEGIIEPKKVRVVNTTGAGDSFMSALIWAYYKGKDIEYACKSGNIAASITLRSLSTVSSNMSEQNILSNVKE